MPAAYLKRYASRALFDEAWERSRRAAEVSRGARWFRAPEVLGGDPDRLEIRFELMEGWSVLTTLLRSRRFLGFGPPRLDAIFRNTGRALAEYHAGSGEIHGDFDSTNILFRADDPRICVLDFSRPDFADRPDYFHGTPYRDLALFLIHLRVKYPPHQLLLAYRAENRLLSRVFLDGYFELSPEPYSFDSLSEEFATCMKLPYLSRTFLARVLGWTDRFDLGDLR